MRQDVLVNNKIISRWLPPRRLWDLYSNRVVPWWVAHEYPLPISHAWMKEEDRAYAHTPINGWEWPVPMPRDANLDLIRIEMLNAGAEYAWLDVLCLRQAGGREENLRAEEWKVDVPTIGRVYDESCMRVVCYLSGLGRPFSMKAADLESETCWFRRAWTLQEVNIYSMTIGGDTGDDRFIAQEMRMQVQIRLALLEMNISGLDMPVFTALSEMQKRVATNPLDRVAGLSYLALTHGIPAYYATQSEEDAWNALVDEMHTTHRGQMFFHYPQPGNGNIFWRPSWKQAMDGDPSPHLLYLGLTCDRSVQCTKAKDADRRDGPCIESGYVRGLFHRSLERNFREGELIVEDITGAKHTFMIVAYHQYPIPEGLYALVGSDPCLIQGTFNEQQYWVVGERLPGEVFKKVSVFQIHDKKDIERLHELGVTTDTGTFLA